MPHVADLFNIPIPPPLRNKTDKRLLTDDLVGVEVELENLTMLSELRAEVDHRWRVVEDGSLRGMSGEFVFAAPMFGVDVTETLASLQDTFDILGLTPTTGERTSVHVHLDVRDLSYQQLLNLILVYLLCEPYFFAVGGEERKSSPYSFPLATSEDYLERIGAVVASNSYGIRTMYSHHIIPDAKYSAFNIAPVGTQGSVELRHHRGTYNMDELLKWVNMALCLKRFTRTLGDIVLTPERIDDIVSGSYEAFIDDVFDGVDVPRNVDGWDNAARVAKRVSASSTASNRRPILLPHDEGCEGNLFTETQRLVATYGINPRDFIHNIGIETGMAEEEEIEYDEDEEYDEEYDEEGEDIIPVNSIDFDEVVRRMRERNQERD